MQIREILIFTLFISAQIESIQSLDFNEGAISFSR